VSATASISAKPSIVYGVLSDYSHHARILPPQYFTSLEVESGGVGAGTRVRGTVRVLGTTTTFRHVVKELEPGRVLVEEDVEGRGFTSFTVEPMPGGSSQLTILTEFAVTDGILGPVELMLTRITLLRIYRKELALIAEYVTRPGLQIP